MFAQDAKFAQLLDTLGEHALIKAALLLDRFGRVRDRRGFALSLKPMPGEEERTEQLEKNPSRESLYMVEIEASYVLVVIFDENIDFESIRQDVDMLLRQLDLRRGEEA